MEVKKVGGFEGLAQPERVGKVQGGGPSFADTLNGVQSNIEKNPQIQNLNKPAGAIPAETVKFSNHAIERMQSRGVSFNKGDLEKLNEAVSRAAGKGSKDTLVLLNDAALIVSVKNKTVVTVMDKAALKENVFTNIDSTIVM